LRAQVARLCEERFSSANAAFDPRVLDGEALRTLTSKGADS